MPAPFNPQQWGQTRLIDAAAWQPNQEQSVATITTPQRAAHVAPKVRTIICGVENTDDTSQSYILRWRLALGLGGARVSVDFDATRYTRISAPFDEARVSLYADPFPVGGLDVPGVSMQAFAFVADGYAEQSAPGPMFSESFALLPAQQIIIPLPVGANRFRVIGSHPSGDTPFRTTTLYFLRAGAASIRAQWPGLGAVPGVGDMLGIFNRSDFVPIASGATELVITESAGVAVGFVQFGLDL